ncbi:MAG: hybrid sensor histidine kinase/response regulator [Polyangiales bacterium]
MMSVEAIERSPTNGGAGRPFGPEELRRTREQPPLVVVIDDNRDLVDAMVEALAERGYRVVGFRSALEALSALDQLETPSLIVFDLMMPQMDGWTFRVKQKALPRLRDVPVIVMTASGSSQAEAIDADLFLRKPLSVERFCASVEQTIASHARRALFARSIEIERLRALGVLAASVAHEINNPLAYVAGNLDLVLNDWPKLAVAEEPTRLLTTIRKRLGDARHGTTQVADIVRSLLIFGRTENDSAHTADVARAIEGAVRLSTAYVRRKAELRTDVPQLPRVLGQEGRLGQVFLNLVMNAAQAIPPNAIDTNVITITARKEGDEVTVSVSDTGVGMNEQVRARVFEAFFTTKPAGEGTGIGLSFCKEMVEQLGGSIAVTSHPGDGATFTVRLPIAPPDDDLQ